MDSMHVASMLDFEKICRVCMRSDQDLVLIFDEISDGLSKMLDDCNKYKVIQGDALPQQICNNCSMDLKNAYHFKQECEKSYRYMMEILADRMKVDQEDTDSILNAECCLHMEKGTQTAIVASHPCELCDRKFFDLNELQAHRANDHKGSAIVCRFCINKFDRILYRRSHIVFEQDSGYIFHKQCNICQRQFSCKEHIRRYLRVVHTLVSPPELKDVDGTESGSEDEHDMEKRLSLNPIEPIQTVLINENDTENIPNFEVLEEEEEDTFDVKHEKYLSNDSSMSIRKKNEPYSPSNSSYNVCSVNTLNSSATNAYSYEDCKDNTENETQHKKHRSIKYNEEKNTCSICQKSFSRRINLKRHLRVHDEKRFTCRDCSQSFITKNELYGHQKSEGHDKPMLCPECGLRCKSSSSLMAHMRRHTGEKPFKCKFCNKGFPRSDDLKQHEMYHTNEKSHFCETCGKGFQRKYNLTLHLRVHTGEKPHKCPHCPQAFSQGHDLKLHIRRHTGERLRCEFCDATFLQGYQIRQHKLTMHGIKEDPPNQRVAKFISPEQQEKQIKEIRKRQIP